MSITSELNRLQQAKTDLATSITNKGVTVPAATTLDEYASLIDQIQQGGGSIDILDEMKNVYVAIPYSAPYNTNYGFLCNFEYGKSYKVIVKPRHAFTGRIDLYCYLGNANTPNILMGQLLAGDTIKEFTYTHNDARTFTICGIWVTVSGERNVNHSCAVYIKEI